MSTLASIKVEVRKVFERIGKSKDTANPDIKSNLAPIAHEYFIADLLASMANKRKEVAKKAAENAGIVVEDIKPGETRVTFDGECMIITGKTANPAERLDPTLLKNALTKELGLVKALKIITDCTVKNKPATSYSFAEK